MSEHKVEATVSLVLRGRQVVSPLLGAERLPLAALVLVALDEVDLGEDEDEEIDHDEAEQHLRWRGNG